MTGPAVRPPRADAIRNRSRLVDAARQVFAVHGPGATLEQIAYAAGVSRATLNRHFDSRAALAAAVFDMNVTSLEQRAGELHGRPDGLQALFDLLLDMQLANPALAQALSRTDADHFRALARRTVKALEPFVVLARRAGLSHPDVEAVDVVRTLPMAAAALLEDDAAGRARSTHRVRALLSRALFTESQPS